MWRQQDKRVRWWVKDRWACEAEADGGEESTEDGELELCDVELDLIQLPKSTLAPLKQGNRQGANSHRASTYVLDIQKNHRLPFHAFYTYKQRLLCTTSSLPTLEA